MRKVFDELTAADVMRDDVVAIPEAMSLRGAARLLSEAGACAAPVIDTRGQCVGLLFASDAHRWVADGEQAGLDAACYWSEWQMDAAAAGRAVGRRMTADRPAANPDAPAPRDGSSLVGGERVRRRAVAGPVAGGRV